MSPKPSVADTEPFAFRRDLPETIFEAIKGWEVRLPGKPLRGTTGADAEAIAQAIREVYVDGLRNSGSAGQHYLAMRGELVQAHNELDRVSIERSEDGAVHPLPHRVAILAGRYVDEQRQRIELTPDRPVIAAEDVPDGWQGQLPAAGTRRALIRDAIMSHRVFRTVGAPAATTALRLADAIEGALQHPSEPSDEYREDDDRPVLATASAELPKPLFAPGDEVELIEDRDLALEVEPGAVGVVAELPKGRKWCGRCQEWHYGVRFEDREVRVAETYMRHARERVVVGQRSGRTEAMRQQIREDAATPEDAEAAIRELESTGRAFMNGAGQHVGTQGGEPSDDRPPTDDAEEPEDGPFSGSLEIRIGPDGYPWIGVLGLIELFEKLGCAAYQDEEIAEPGPEEADLEGEIDPDVPLWRVEVSRAFDHLLNAARVGFRV